RGVNHCGSRNPGFGLTRQTTQTLSNCGSWDIFSVPDAQRKPVGMSNAEAKLPGAACYTVMSRATKTAAPVSFSVWYGGLSLRRPFVVALVCERLPRTFPRISLSLP